MKRHSLDIFSLVVGTLTLGLAIFLANPDADVTSLGQFVPLAIIAVGVALLLSSTTDLRRKSVSVHDGDDYAAEDEAGSFEDGFDMASSGDDIAEGRP